MEYIQVILAFAAAIVAIVGTTWDKTQTGARKLTTPGRFTLALVVFSLIYSGVSTYQQREQKQTEELDKKKIDKIVSTEIDRSLISLLEPFKSLYGEYKGIGYVPEKEITIEMMLDESALDAAQHTCLALRPKTFDTFPDSGTWNDIFRANISSGLNRVDRLVDRYGIKMNADMLDALHDLQANGYFSGYARPRVVHEGTIEKTKGSLPPCVIGQAIGSHKEYLHMLNRIMHLNHVDTLVR
ncbi:hypothetical protein [Iodobacter fluviatilis]|uniref:Uncharacterized protein n=1 Tax=Iodobacter fluviatilis TaxID=537 RepID=A0A377SXY6_9NEIS|nr:hypothetical protein [Iodobacter fluviatilis]TCU81320.1 hypothetical protein EV682_12333 [Iodobacter fluviatilis]STR45176.1 Uncharacterised protein [Iodobacter fluviatilis]